MALKLLDGTYLMHAGKPYDPQKAHDYYIRNRKLHPRTKGNPDRSSSTVGGNTTTKSTPQQLSEQRAYAAQRIASLKVRLAELTAELHKKLEASTQSAHTKKAPTSVDKQKAAQASKKYRTTHKQEIASKRKASAAKTKTSSTSSKSTDAIKKEIANVRVKLKAAVAAQRQLLT